MTHATRRPGPILLLLSFACASVNLTKAVHIDDTAYLKIAQAILADPLHPMQGELNWDYQTTRPISRVNQPHLLFYVQAAIMLVFGESELAQHAFMALVSGAAVCAFYAVATLFAASSRALLLTALFALGPAFLPGQNLMVDVPLVALWLVFFWALCSERRRAWIAAMAMTAACLVKYNSLILLPIFCAALALRRQWRDLWFLAIPVLGLAAWSLLNYLDYGSVHLLDRRVRPFEVGPILIRSIDAIAGIGAVAPFSVMFLSLRIARRTGKWPVAIAAISAMAMLFVARDHPKCPWSVAVLWALFTGNGVFVLALVCRSIAAVWRRDRVWQYAVVLLWLVGTLGFTIVLSPFMAVRHILPAVPPILLLLGHRFGRLASRRWATIALAATASLGGALAVSDYEHADVYRKCAPEIVKSLPARSNVWFTGHWGWQWYAEKAGMRQYDRLRPGIAKGDYFVAPLLPGSVIAPHQRKGIKLVRNLARSGSVLTRFRTVTPPPGAGYYGYSFESRHLPWAFLTSYRPLERFQIFHVTGRLAH